jgi:Ca2+-binding RTX toxin-like protein
MRRAVLVCLFLALLPGSALALPGDGGPGPDVLNGGPGSDVIHGRGGNDVIAGTAAATASTSATESPTS